MSKGTVIKDALKLWEEKNGMKPEEATVVKLYMQQPFIMKLDSTLGTLVKCEQLSLSTNLIDKISNLQGLACLKILSLSRNNIKKIEGLEAVAETLEELWVSYNQIERLNGIECCKKLKVVCASNNKIKAWDGITCLKDVPVEDVLLQGNPLEEKYTGDGTWIAEMTIKFPKLKKLDGKVMIRDDAGEEKQA